LAPDQAGFIESSAEFLVGKGVLSQGRASKIVNTMIDLPHQTHHSSATFRPCPNERTISLPDPSTKSALGATALDSLLKQNWQPERGP
jgi:hypothetical protein